MIRPGERPRRLGDEKWPASGRKVARRTASGSARLMPSDTYAQQPPDRAERYRCGWSNFAERVMRWCLMTAVATSGLRFHTAWYQTAG